MVTLFVDTSVLLAASGSLSGASSFLCQESKNQGWLLVSSPWCIEETLKNLPKLGHPASSRWAEKIEPNLKLVPNALTLDKLLVFPKTKDRPVLLSALGAKAEVLLTLDREDFQDSIGNSIYGMDICTPGQFLMKQRQIGLI